MYYMAKDREISQQIREVTVCALYFFLLFKIQLYASGGGDMANYNCQSMPRNLYTSWFPIFCHGLMQPIRYVMYVELMS